MTELTIAMFSDIRIYQQLYFSYKDYVQFVY
jgi:hypothetical protein